MNPLDVVKFLAKIIKEKRHDAACMRDKYSRKDWYHGYFKAWDEIYTLFHEGVVVIPPDEEVKRDSPTP